MDAQLDAKKVQIEKLRRNGTSKKQQVADLTIRAGIKGKMQEMTLQVARGLIGRCAGQGRAALETEGAS